MSETLQGQVIGLILVSVVVASMLIGIGRGLVFGIYSVVKNLIIMVAAVGTAPVIAKKLPDTMVAKEGVGYVIAFVVCLIVFNLIGSMIKAVRDVPLVGAADRIGGGVAGIIVGFFIAWTLLAILGGLQEYEWCKGLVQAARENRVVMWFQAYSPLLMLLKSFGFLVI